MAQISDNQRGGTGRKSVVGSDLVRACNFDECNDEVGQVGIGGEVASCVGEIEPDENSIRRQNSRKPLTETMPSSVNPILNLNPMIAIDCNLTATSNNNQTAITSSPNTTTTTTNRQLKDEIKIVAATSGGGANGSGSGALVCRRPPGKFRRGILYSRNKLFSTEFKLLIQFLVIFLSYFVYSLSNILLTYQLTVTTDNRWDKDLLKVFRLMIWSYHLLNPVIFLSFHPIFLNKFFKSSDRPSCKINAAISACLRCF